MTTVIQSLTANDLVVERNASYVLRTRLSEWRGSNGMLEVYGKTPERMLYGWERPRDVETQEDAHAFALWVTKSWEHSQYIIDNIHLLLPLLNPDETSASDVVYIKHAGIKSAWSKDYLEGVFRIKPTAVAEKLFKGVAVLLPSEYNTEYGLHSDRAVYLFDNPKYTPPYLSDGSQPLMIRTRWLAERETWSASIDGIGYARMSLVDNDRMLAYSLPTDNGSINPNYYRRLADGVRTVRGKTLEADMWRYYRTNVLRMEADANGTGEAVLSQLKTDSYEKFWSSMKDSKREHARKLSDDKVIEMWATVPLLETGTPSSRTWGIEIETVRANETSRPRGWESVHDGSLPDGGECDCGCDDCDNYDEHCNSGDCSYDVGESREFVSPILHHFNSEGLRKLCTDLGDDEPKTAPCIHVHVGAEELTVTDVARVLFSYGVVQPFIKQLYHREVYGYCQETPGHQVQWWLTAAKRYLRENGRVPRPSQICDEQPVNRYYDVNTQSLNKHGTLEFRAMGPFYNYDHLVRWAWFCREIVNVSRLNLDQRLWTSCNSLSDVINLLRKYGSESPDNKVLPQADNYEE